MLVENPGPRSLGRLGIEMRILTQMFFKKQNMRKYTGFNWLNIRFSEGLL
jgi:hypothetical protein